MGTKLDGLNYELQQELRDLEEALKDYPQPTIQSLLKLKGDEAQYKLDLLQLLVDLTNEKHTRSITRKVLFRLSKSSGRVPQCLVIRNIKRVGDPFGGGGFGDIWKGEIGDFPGNSIECAVKVGRWYRNVDGEDEYEDAVKTHLREAILWGQLKHPNLLPFLGMYYLDDSKRDVCLVSPYLASGNLTRYLKRTPPEEIDSHGLMYDIATGIEYLHSEDIVHGDLKGANILMRAGVDFRIHACICDFGLSRLAVTYGLGPTMSCWGITNGCTAPEVIRGRLSSKESDMYSFGVLCYEIIRKLYDLSSDVDRDSPPRLLANLPPEKDWLWSLICQSWKTDLEARPTAVDVVKQIIAFNANVVKAPLWDESLYSRIMNNVDFGPLLANAAALRNRSQLAAIELSYRELLDKITMENFDSISNEIIALVNKGELACRQVALLVYERATHDPRTSELYAKLCRKMLEQIFSFIWRRDDVKDAKGKAITGGQLFRKDLCDQCREDFEGNWIAKVDGELQLDGDHTTHTHDTKRRGLGLIKFIGELFNLQMLSKQGVHNYVKGLLGSGWSEEHIESIHVLISTVGKSLDTTKADKRKMHTYVSKIREIKRRPDVAPRLQLMLQDVLDLRTRNWVPRPPQGGDRLTVESQLDSGDDGTLNFRASEGPLSLSMLQSTQNNVEDGRSNDDQWIMVDSDESSRCTHTESNTLSQHSLPVRPDWAVGLKPSYTLFGKSKI